MTGEGGNHTDDGSSSSTDNTTQKKIGEYPQSYLLEKAKEIVADRTKDWEITDAKAEDRIPRFHRDGTCSVRREVHAKNSSVFFGALSCSIAANQEFGYVQ